MQVSGGLYHPCPAGSLLAGGGDGWYVVRIKVDGESRKTVRCTIVQMSFCFVLNLVGEKKTSTVVLASPSYTRATCWCGANWLKVYKRLPAIDSR